ncbi:hypothetical protein WOLCODRAFT_154058 [Wolfiporia cocos MD-104 SS10]|uniref:Uncharacterized protein n=1 Tax=Wolfiporia cocos (strain MD-104) TaxID=742152 RepID=A0A2H3K4N4_WOLCO|nr:hypothetical protein WOLCODRAFT_154058 [Wolfiporia cocos MD-104 SS10]
MGGGGGRDGCNEWAAQGEWGHADWGVMHAGMGTACFKATAMAGLGNKVGGNRDPAQAHDCHCALRVFFKPPTPYRRIPRDVSTAFCGNLQKASLAMIPVTSLASLSSSRWMAPKVRILVLTGR